MENGFKKSLPIFKGKDDSRSYFVESIIGK
jgi:hypothetical protein